MNGTGLGHHLVLRLRDDRVIAPDAAARRALVAAIHRVGEGYGLLAFGAADTHLHVLALVDRAAAGRLARALAVAIGATLDLPVGFDITRIRPIEDQRHLINTFRYVQSNAAHHGIADLAATEASSLHDLLGLRTGGSWLVPRVQAHLPRVGRAHLVEMLGLSTLPTRTDADPFLVDAAAAVMLLPDLQGRSAAATEGRRAVVALAGAEVRVSHAARSLGISERAVRMLRVQPVQAAVVEALRRQLAWRSVCSVRQLVQPVGAPTFGVCTSAGTGPVEALRG